MLNFPCVRKYRIIILAVIILAIVGLGIYFLIKVLRPVSAGVLIETVPAASVFIDGGQVGRTPYKETRKPGEIIVKLIPESADTPLAPYETKVSLASGIETVIRREFGATDETSSGDIVSYERVGGRTIGLSVVSIPDGAQVSVDGTVRGFVPYKSSSITPGEHQIVVSSPGYIERSLTIKTVRGYKVTAVIKLAPSPETEVKGEEDVQEKTVQELVEILSTPTGFLRVRSGPSTANEEVFQVKPGESYPILEEDSESGWFKIEYEKDKEGWVSNQYAKKLSEEEAKATPTSTPTLKASPSPTPSAAPTTSVSPTVKPTASPTPSI